jgi:1-acyl-sn-glycerol-3-phosphate acyltransferase
MTNVIQTLLVLIVGVAIRDISQKQNKMQRQGVIFLVLMIGCSLGIQVMQYPMLLILVAPLRDRRAIYRFWTQWSQELFTSLMVVVTYLCCPVTIELTGDFDILRKKERLVLIANHQIYTDWWYVWLVAWFEDKGRYLKIILKDSLSRIPIFGWGMQFFEFIFLKRKWNSDKETFLKNLSRAKKDGLPLWLLIFPEGTNLTADTKAKCLQYAKKHDITEIPEFVLLPRSLGLSTCLSELQDFQDLHLIDITMGFSGVSPEDTPQYVYPLGDIFLKGLGPPVVHLHIKSHPLSAIPGFTMSTDDSSLLSGSSDPFGQWLRQEFLRKDALMKHFYSHGEFTGLGSGSEKSKKVFSPEPRWLDIYHVTLSFCVSIIVLRLLLGLLWQILWNSWGDLFHGILNCLNTGVI